MSVRMASLDGLNDSRISGEQRLVVALIQQRLRDAVNLSTHPQIRREAQRWLLARAEVEELLELIGLPATHYQHLLREAKLDAPEEA